MQMKYLEIGANKLKGPDWAFIDTQNLPGAIVHDMRQPLHFIQDNSIEGIYTEHFIEHLDKNEGINALKEALRILKPGSRIRIVWPNGEVLDRLRSDEDLSNDEFVLSYGKLISTLDWNTPNRIFDRLQDKCADSLSYQRGEHKYLWHIQELIECLQSIGFAEVYQEKYLYSSYEPFNAIDTNDRVRELHSAVIEAIK
jgi:SAM-dependent methyltransferase